MTNSKFLVAFVVVSLIGFQVPAYADGGACAQIVNRCKQAGFKPGGGSMNGLWFDCVAPILNNHPQPARATAPLPDIDQKTINMCKTENPNFLKGKINE